MIKFYELLILTGSVIFVIICNFIDIDDTLELNYSKGPIIIPTTNCCLEEHPCLCEIEDKEDFNYCDIIMDDEKNNLAGSLSKPNIRPKKSIYIGPQSRFEYQEKEKKYDFLAIISGPEPQRTILEKGLILALKDRKEKSLIVLGKPELKNEEKIGTLTIKSHLKASELNTAILQSHIVICRPGYSTIMDLAKLERKAIFIHTPGQTEQEYLAENFMSKGICYSQNQSDFNFELALKESKNYNGFSKRNSTLTNWEELFRLF